MLALNARQKKVADALHADPALRYAYDVQNVSPKEAPSGPVSVMLGLRESSRTIISGEYSVPPGKWDWALFRLLESAKEVVMTGATTDGMRGVSTCASREVSARIARAKPRRFCTFRERFPLYGKGSARCLLRLEC